MTTVTAYEVRPASPRLCAEIVGADLAEGVDEATAGAPCQELRTHTRLQTA
jgi:hypothetical protein